MAGANPSDTSTDSIFDYRARPLEAAQPPPTTTSMGVAALAESPDGVVPHPSAQPSMGRLSPAPPDTGHRRDLTENEFGNQDLANRMAAAGVSPSLIEGMCGPIAAAGALKAYGINADPAKLAAWGQANGEWSGQMNRGSGVGLQAMLAANGLQSTVEAADPSIAVRTIQGGGTVVLNFPNHYMTASDYDPQTGKFYVGSTGSNALRGGSDWMTMAEMQAAPGNGGGLRSIIVPTGAASTAAGQSPQQGTPSEASAGVAPPTTTSGAVMGAMDRGGDIRSFVRERAQAYGIDPNTAEAVVGSEGGFDDWARQSDYVYKGKRETSYGPLQLLVGGGLGDTFMAETGLDPRDPKNGPAATDWALKYASQHGWGDWHGAQRIGLGNYAGIGATTPSGTPLDTRYLDASRSTTTPGGIGTTTGGYGDVTPDGTSATSGVTPAPPDPLAPVRASLDRTGQALSDFGSGVLTTAAGAIGGASDAARGAIGTATDVLRPAATTVAGGAYGAANDALNPRMGTVSPEQNLRDYGTLATQSAQGAADALKQAYDQSPGYTGQAIAHWVQTGDASRLGGTEGVIGRALQFLTGPMIAAGGAAEYGLVDPARRALVGGTLAQSEGNRQPDLAAAQARYKALPGWLQTTLGFVVDPAILAGPPAGHGAARAVEAGAQEVGRLGEGLVAPTAGAIGREMGRGLEAIGQGGMAGGASAAGPIAAEHVPPDFWTQQAERAKGALAKKAATDSVEAGIERLTAANPDPSPAELKAFAGDTSGVSYGISTPPSGAEVKAAAAEGRKAQWAKSRGKMADFMPHPTTLETGRQAAATGIRLGFDNWYADVPPALRTRFDPRNATEANYLFTAYGQTLSPEDANRAVVATMDAARANDWFRGLASLPVKQAKQNVRADAMLKLIRQSWTDLSGVTGLAKVNPDTLNKVFDIYAKGATEVTTGAKLSDFGMSNITGAHPNLAITGGAADKHMGRFWGYLAYGDAENAYAAKPAFYRYVNTVSRQVARDLSVPLERVQAAIWGVQKMLTMPISAGEFKQFRALNPEYADDITRFLDPSNPNNWVRIAERLRKGELSVDDAYAQATALGLFDHPWKSPGQIEQSWQGRGLEQAVANWQARWRGGERMPVPPRGGYSYTGPASQPQGMAGARALALNPLAQRSRMEASTLSLEGTQATGAARSIAGLDYPHTVVDTGGDFSVALPVLNPEHTVTTAQALADRTGTTVNVVRMPVRGEQANALVFSLDRANISRAPQAHTGLEDAVPRMRDALAPLGVDVHFDGRQVRFIAHTNRVEDVGAAGDAVRGVVQSLGIDPSIVRVGGRVGEAYFPRGAGAVDRSLGLPAGGSVAGRGQYADDLRAALEQGIGRLLPRGATAPADAATGALASPSPASTTLAVRGVGTVAGGVIGAAAPANTPEERLKHAAIGAGVGFGLDVGAAAVSRRLAGSAVRAPAGSALAEVDAVLGAEDIKKAAVPWPDVDAVSLAVNERLFNRFARLWGLGGDVRDAIQSLGGSDARTRAILETELRPILQSTQVTDLNRYLVAAQIPDLVAGGFKTPRGLTAERATAALDELRAALGPRRYAAVEDAATRLYEFQDRNVLQRAVDSGLVSAEGAKAMRAENPHYFPHEVFDKEVESRMGLGQKDSLSVGTSGIKARKGSELDIRQPLDAIVNRAYAINRLADRNDAANLVVPALEREGMAAPLRVAADVRERISLYAENKALRPIRDGLERMIGRRGNTLEALYTAIAGMERDRYQAALQGMAERPAAPEQVASGLDIRLQRAEGALTREQMLARERTQATAQGEINQLQEQGYRAKQREMAARPTPPENLSVYDAMIDHYFGLDPQTRQSRLIESVKPLPENPEVAQAQRRTAARDRTVAQAGADLAAHANATRTVREGDVTLRPARPSRQELRGFMDALVTGPISRVEKLRKAIGTRERWATDLLDQIEELHSQYHTTRQVMGENLAQARALGDKGLPVGKGRISRMVDGIKEEWAVDPEIERAVKQMDAESAGPIARFFGMLNAPSRAAYTVLSPAFLARNVGRDIIDRYYRRGRIPGPDYLRGIFAAVTHNADWEAFMRNYGGYAGLAERMGGRTTVEDLARSGRSRFARTVTNPFELMRSINEVAELGPKIGDYVHTAKQGTDPRRAAMLAREGTVDYWMGGSFAKTWNPVIMFLNANLRALYNAAEPLAVGTPKERALAAVRLGTLAAAAGAVYEWNRHMTYRTGDKRGQPMLPDVPQYDQNVGFAILTGETQDEQGRTVPTYIRVPKPSALVPVGIAIDEMLKWRHGQRGQGALSALGGFASGISPVNPSDVGGTILPPVVQVPEEVRRNYSDFRQAPIEPDKIHRLGAQYRELPGTPASAKLVTQTRVGGQSLAERTGLSAPLLDYAGHNIGGGVYDTLAYAADAGVRALGWAPAKPPTTTAIAVARNPLTRGVFAARGGQQDQALLGDYEAQRAAATRAAVDALQQTPLYQRADKQTRENLIANVQQRVDATLRDRAPEGTLPAFLQPQQPDGPPKYDPKIVPPEMRAKYAVDPYQLQRDIESAQQAVAAYTRDPKNNPKPTRDEQQLAARARYVSPEWARWNLQARRPAAADRQRTLQGVVSAATATP